MNTSGKPIEIDSWMEGFLSALTRRFGERVWFVGLQGSYGRGEATETSDLDTVVILDRVAPEDIRVYREVLDAMPHREKLCGFFSGREELLRWEPSDLFQFYFDTIPVVGSLDELLPRIDKMAVHRAIQMGACNIYHGCVHNMLHEQSEEILKALYKAASFVVQAICMEQGGKYIRRQQELLEAVRPEEQAIVRTFLHLKQGGKVEFAPMSEELFAWAQRWIQCA